MGKLILELFGKIQTGYTGQLDVSYYKLHLRFFHFFLGIFGVGYDAHFYVTAQGGKSSLQQLPQYHLIINNNDPFCIHFVNYNPTFLQKFNTYILHGCQ